MGRVPPAVCLLATLLLYTPSARDVAWAQKPPATGGAATGEAVPTKKPQSSPGSAGSEKSSTSSPAPTNEPTQRTPTFGGTGGTAFELRCGQGYVLTGLRGRQGLVVDRVGLLCRPVRTDGTLGSETTVAGEVGGGGGNAAAVSCASGDVVAGLSLRFGTYVDSVSLVCRNWRAGNRSMGARAVGERKLGGDGGSGTSVVICGSDRQPGAGIRGRAGGVLDSVGLVCNEP